MLCARCECRPREYEPSPWFLHMWFLYSLQAGGYPLDKDDLTIEEWMDLGVLKKEIQGMDFRVR